MTAGATVLDAAAEIAGRSLWQDAWRRLLHNRAAVVAGTADGNGDGDANDANVFLKRNRVGAPLNLGRSATAVRMSERWIAALVSERGDGGLHSV